MSEEIKLPKESEDLTERNSEFEKNLWKSHLFQLCYNFHFILGVLVPFFLYWGRITFFEIMMLQAFFMIVNMVMEIPCGAVSDKISRKFSLFLGSVILALAVVVYSTIPNIFMFLIGETLFGTSMALISGTVEAFNYDTLRKLGKEEEMTKVTSRNMSFVLMGIMFSAPIGSLIASLISLRFVMTAIMFPAIIAALISLTMREPNDDLKKTEIIPYLEMVKSGFKRLKENKILRILAVDMIIVEIIAFMIIWTNQLYLDLVQVDIIYFGIVSSLMTGSQILFSNIIPKIMEKSEKNRLILRVYSIIPAIGYILLSFVFTPILGIILILLIIGAGLTRRIILTKAINHHIDSENRATVLSSIGMIRSLLISILYLIVGVLVMWSLSYTFLILGVSLILISLFSRVKNDYL